MTDSYRKAIEDAKIKLIDLMDRREKIDADIERTKAAIKALAYMFDDAGETSTELTGIEEIIGPGGMTEAIRRVLQSATEGLTPTETKDALIVSGFSLAGYSNALASIHTILKRLVQSGDVELTLKNGKTAYSWKGIRRFPRTSSREAKRRAFIGRGALPRGK